MLKKLILVAIPLASLFIILGCDAPSNEPPKTQAENQKPADPEKNKTDNAPNAAGPENPPPPL